jgi:hypothetical protein
MAVIVLLTPRIFYEIVFQSFDKCHHRQKEAYFSDSNGRQNAIITSSTRRHAVGFVSAMIWLVIMASERTLSIRT